MAMKQPHARIIRGKSQHRITSRINSNGIPPHRHSGEVPCMAVKTPRIRRRPLADLELVAVQMEGMDCGVEVVDCDLDNGTG